MSLDWRHYADLMNICNASYYETVEQRAPLYPQGAKEIAYLKGKTDARAIIVELDGKTIVAHQGTELTWRSIRNNLLLAPIVVDGITVIQGYYDQYRDLAAQVAQYKPDVRCGHSMGGCAALISGVFDEDYNGGEIVAFAPPKCISKDSWPHLKLNLTRFTYANDFAVGWPWWIFWNAGAQGGKSYWISRSLQAYQEEPPVAAYSFSDHVIPTYVTLFDKLANG